MGNNSGYNLDDYKEIDNTSQKQLDTSPLNTSNLSNWQMYETPGEEYTGHFLDKITKFEEGIPYSQAIQPYGFESRRHEEQTGIGQFGNMLNQAIVGSVIGGTIEGIGYLFDMGDTFNAIANGEVVVGNFLSNAGKSLNEWTQEATPIYTDPFKEGEFSPGDWSWWMSNMPSIASTLSLMLPSGLAVKGLSSLGKAAKIGTGLSKTSKVMAKGVAQATISRQMEAMMEASSVQEDVLNTLVSQGINYDVALGEASKAAAKTYKQNWAMLAQDIVQYTTMIKPFGKATTDLSIKAARKLGKDITPIITNKFAAVGKDMFGESVEEGYQYIVGQRARDIAEYNVGLKAKKDLSETISESLGEGDFWTSAFFGALGAGFMQTAGKSLNLARERIRGLESAEQARIRDIDSWGKTIQGLSNIDSVGESMEDPNINTRTHKLANFGLNLAKNGNTGWFLEVADDLKNMSEEDQNLFGFTPEDLQEANKNFPTLKQDVQKIGEYYENIVNTKEILQPSVDMAVYNQFLADKLLEEYGKQEGEYSSKINNVSQLNIVNTPSNVRDLIIKEKIELNNLLKLRRELKKQKAPQSVLEELDGKISNLREEVKESKKEFSEEESKKYDNFNARAMSFRQASSSYLRKEFTLADHKTSLDRVDYYTDPKNQKEIEENIKKADESAIEDAVDNASSPQDIENIQAEVIPSDVEGESTFQKGDEGQNLESILNSVINKRTGKEIQEDNDKLESQDKEQYDSVEDILLNKYQDKPFLLNNDIDKLINAENSGELYEGLTENEQKSISHLAKNLKFSLRQNKSLEVLGNALGDIKIFETEASEKLLKNILKILNKEIKKTKENTSKKDTKESINSPSRNSIGVNNEGNISIRRKHSERKGEQDEYSLKDYSKGEDFVVVDKVGGKVGKELGIDTEALGKGEVKVGDVVYFEVDKQDSYEKTNKNNPETRGYDIVSYKGNKRIVLGKVRTSEKALREILNKQINRKYKSNKRYIQADITSEVTGGLYYFSQGEYGTPKEKLTKEDQQKFSKYGGYVMDYVEVNEDDHTISGKTNLPDEIEITESFNNSEAGGIIIPVSHPLVKEKYLFIRAFYRNLKQYKESGLPNSEERYNKIVETISNLFEDYINNPTAENKKAIGNIIITRKIELKNDNIILYPRQSSGKKYIIPVENFKENPDYIDWVDDSVINIEKKKVNTQAEIHNIGFGAIGPIAYNDLVGDFIQLNIKKNQYLSNVRLLIKKVDNKKKDVANVKENISEEQTTSSKISTEQDPGEQVKEDINLKGNENKESFEEEKQPLQKENKPTGTIKKPEVKNKISASNKLIEQAIKNKNKDTRTRSKEDRNLPKWNKKEEISWFNKNYKNVPLEVLENLKEIIANGFEYWGVFKNAAIYIESNAATGTLYHEAFHAVFNLFTTPKQRAILLGEAARRYNLNKDKYKSLEDYNIALEEEMADDYMEVVQLEQVPKSFIERLGKTITDFFRNIQALIKSLYKNPVYNIDEFFWRANNGFYKDAKISQGSFGTTVSRARPKGWTNRQENIAANAINGHLITSIIPAIREQNLDYSNLTDVEIINEIGLDELLKNVSRDFIDLLESNAISEKEKSNIKELLLNLYDFDKNVFRELKNSVIRGLEKYDIKIKEDEALEVGEYDSEDTSENESKEAENNAEDKKEGWQDTAIERSTKNNALKEVKVFIRNMSSGYKNIYGLDSLVDYNETYDTLLKNLAGTTDVEDMISFLESDKIIHPEYQQILDEFKIDPSFKTKFFTSFNKNHTKYNMISYINGNYAVYQANRKGLTQRIISNWSENIINNNNITDIDSKGNITIKEDIKEYISNVKKEVDDTINNWTKEVKEDYYKNLSEALNNLGLNISTKVLFYLGSTDNKKVNGKDMLNNFFKKGTNKFYYILNKLNDLKNPFDAEGGLDAGEAQAIRNAANIVGKASIDMYESSFRNINGKTVYAHLEQNFLSKLTHRLQNPNRRDSVLEKYKQDQLFYYIDEENKIFHNRILKDVEENKNIFDIMITEGLTDDQNNRISYQSLDTTGLKLYTIHNYFNNGNETEGWYRSPVLSDAPNGIVFKNRKSSKDIILGNLALLAEAEYNRILTIKEQIKDLPKNKHIKNYHIPENADISSGYHIIQGMRKHKAVDRTKTVEIIDKWLLEQTKEYFQSLLDSKVIILKDGEVSEDSRLDSRLIKKYKTEKQIKEFIQEFYYNDYLSRAEFTLMTVGDPAFYGSSREGNNKTIDFVKRAKEIYSPKSLIDTDGFFIDSKTKERIEVEKQYKTVYLKDNEIASPSLEATRKALEKANVSTQKIESIIRSYQSVNQTDAQAYITLPFYRKTMIGIGKWTNKHQEAYKRLIKGTGIGSDISLMLQPLKPFAYGMVWSDDIGRLIPVQNKNSEYLLLPQLALDRKEDGSYSNESLANLYHFMDINKIDSINFDSAVKAGLSKVVDTSIFSSKEKTSEFINTFKEDPNNWSHILQMEDRGIQQEVPEHFVDANNLFGTQIRKLIMSDLVEGTNYIGMDKTKLLDHYQELLVADLIEAYSKLENKIVKKDGSIDYKFVHDLLLDEARNRGKGEEFEKAIQYDGKRNRLSLPLYNPVTARSAQNLITSIFKSRITKQKISGGAFVQLSSFGLSDDLKLKYNEKGGLQYAEVMLPAWSKKFFKDYTNEFGDVDFKAIEKSSPEILEMVGYRIPTEDKYSMLPMRVVGFLPYTAGGAIMLPADITEISGSDFDVDKMYVMMKTFKTSKFNKKEFKKDLKDFSKDNEDFKEVDLSNNNIDIILDQILNNQTLNDEDLPIYNFYIKNKEKYGENKYKVEEYDENKTVLENTKNSRNNRKIDIILSVLRNSNTLESIMSGGTFEPLKKIAELTEIKVGKTKIDLNPISVSSMDKMHIDNMTGKSLVGIAANENAFHSIAQQFNLELKTPVLFEGEKLHNLSGQKANFYVEIKNKNVIIHRKHNQKISKNKAYYLAAIVDNAKDPLASYINYNSYTSGITGLLLQSGLDPATVTWFLKQPIIEDITKRFFESGENWSVESNIIQEYKDKFGIKKDPKNAENLNTKELFDNLGKSNDKYQEKVFKSFLVYKKLAKDWTSLVLASRADTKGFGPTLADSEIILESIENVKSGLDRFGKESEFSISGTNEIFREDSNTLVSGFTKYGLTKPSKIVSEMFPYSQIDGLYMEIKRSISSNIKNRELSANERNKINDQITSYLLSKFEIFNPNEREYFLNKFPKEFLDIKEKDAIFANNYLIRRLQYRSKISDKKLPIERIEFNNTGSLNNEQKNDIQKAWMDLYESEEYRDLAIKLFKYSYFTTGLTFNINGFSHLLPIDMLNDKGVKDKYENSLADSMYNYIDYSKEFNGEDVTAFKNQFYKNNYKNKAFVPMVSDDYKNITNVTKDKKGNITGFIVNTSVKNKEFVLNDEENKEKFVPFISANINNNIELFQIKEQIGPIATYEITNKLGFPNNIYEYMIGAPNLNSVLPINGAEGSIEESVIEKEILPKVREVQEEAIISNSKYEVYTSEKDEKSKDYRLKFTYKVNNKQYDITVRTIGGLNIYTNNNTKETLKKDSALIKHFKNVTSLVNKENCG